MRLLEAIGIAGSQLWSNKLRSTLTLLGMLIGVGSVIGIVSIGEGMRRTIVDEFAKLGGGNLIVISPQRRILKDGHWVEATDYDPLTLKDIHHIEFVSKRISSALPLLQTRVKMRSGKSTNSGELVGTMPLYSKAFDWKVANGRFLIRRDVAEERTVCVLGQSASANLFGTRSPLGREVKLNGRRFTVVGVMEERRIFGQDWGNQALVPVTTAQKRFLGGKQIGELIVHTNEPADVFLVMPAIEKALTRYHGKGAVYRIDSGKGILEEVEQTILIMKLVAGCVAGISLLIGGVGIMNIMLVSVAERTREIGIRKALGAKPAALLLQFAVEAMALSFTGAMLGVGMGVGLGQGISRTIKQYTGFPFPSVVTPESIAMSLVIALSVGLFFGIFPAARASRMDPVDALRSE